jgi:hypothetical protein
LTYRYAFFGGNAGQVDTGSGRILSVHFFLRRPTGARRRFWVTLKAMITVRRKLRDQSIRLQDLGGIGPNPPEKNKKQSAKKEKKNDSKLWGLEPKVLDFFMVYLLFH